MAKEYKNPFWGLEMSRKEVLESIIKKVEDVLEIEEWFPDKRNIETIAIIFKLIHGNDVFRDGELNATIRSTLRSIENNMEDNNEKSVKTWIDELKIDIKNECAD